MKPLSPNHKGEMRRPVPLQKQRDVALRQLRELMTRLGYEEGPLELDHDPALALRPIDPTTGLHVPPQHETSALVWRPKAVHKLKTTGRQGESKLSIDFNGDTSRAAKVKRILKASAKASARAEEDYRRQLLRPEGVGSETADPISVKPKSRWPKRSLRSRSFSR